MAQRRMPGYTAYVLTDESRAQLLKSFPPAYPDVIAHHATIELGGEPGKYNYGEVTNLTVVGHAAGDGVEAVVVEVDGTIYRPDGKLFHITVSIDRSIGKKPVDSNRLLVGGYDKVKRFNLDATLQHVA